MKGVILSINPDARTVDISHQIPPQDVEAGAFNSLNCYKDFPARTIHVAVVDPGVGSDRRAILIECADQFFIGPDNGLFSWICEREKDWTALHITSRSFFRPPVSNTFHGRDIFAPVAAHLSRGIAPRDFGEPVQNIVRLPSLTPNALDDHTLDGRIIHIDRFGNCVTNFKAGDLSSRGAPTSWKLHIGGAEISELREFFAGSKAGEVFCIVGSSGFVEVCARNDSAAQLLAIKRGAAARLVTANLADIRARAV